MYSKKIEEFFTKNKINISDKILIISKNLQVEGTLMPNTEANSEDSILIKLNNGYNIGLKFSEIKITKLNLKDKKVSIPKYQNKSNPKLPSIKLIYTGGTIGSKIDYATGGVYVFTKPEELLHEVPELADIANIRVNNLLNIPSEDMTYIEWKKIAETIAESLNSGSRGVIVSMGTDTMHYASAALSFMLNGLNAPVVITGAQRSSDRGSSDAFMNLICSAHIASKSDIAEVGICMHSTSSDDKCHMIRGTKARKMHTSRRDAFRPINDRPIADVGINGKIEYISDYKKANTEKKITLYTGFEPKVAIVVAHPNSNPSIMDFYFDKGYKGIIIEGTGLGHTPSSVRYKEFSWIEKVKDLTKKGVIIGITSQCIYGRVNNNVYRNLRFLADAGAINCEDMTVETAYVKLGWLLGNYSKDEARKLLNENMRGEIKKRTDYDTFLV